MLKDFSQKSNELLTYKEAACLLRLSPGTLRNWVCDGRLQAGRDYIKYGKSKKAPVRLKQRALMRFVEQMGQEGDHG